MKKILIIFSIILILFIGVIFGIYFYEMSFLEKYDETQVQISFIELKKVWGDPNRVLYYDDGRKTVFYYTFLNEFVFNVDENDLITLKYKDNF